MEREQELVALESGLTGARGRAGRTIVIEAPAGTGKSRLLTVAGDRARDAGMQILGASASELEQDSPFGLAIQLFEPRWSSTDLGDRAALLQGPARTAGALLGGGLPETHSSSDRGYPLIHGLFSLAVNLASVGPLVMLVDDVHWSDRPSFGFLAYLASRLADLPILLIAAFRRGETAADQRALSALMSTSTSVMLRPAPISCAGIERLVRAEFPAADEVFVAACARATGGNPLLLSELLVQLSVEGRPPDATTAARLTDLPSEAIVDSVVARLGMMPADARTLACAVSVLGDGAWLRHAARLAGLESESAAQAADVLAAARVFRPGAPLCFVHPLIRSSVAASMSLLARGRAHRIAATILREDRLPSEAIAAHLLCSPPAADPETVTTLRSAAHKALAAGSAASAGRLLERALAEPPPADVRAEVVADLVRAEALDEVALLRSQALHSRARDLDVAYVPTASLVPEMAREATRRRQRLVDRLADPPTPAQRAAIAHVAFRDGMRGEPRTAVRELADLAWGDGALLAAAAGDPQCLSSLTGALLFADELERDIEICNAGVDAAGERGSPVAHAMMSYCRAWPLYETGRILEAAADAEAALDAPNDWQTHVCMAHGVLSCCHIQRGQLEQAERALAVLEDRDLQDTIRYPFLLERRAQLRLAQHRAREALEDALSAGEILQYGFAATSPGVIAWRSTAAFAYLALGEHDRARSLAAQELQDAERLGIARVVIRDLRVLGLAGRGEAGIELLTQAVVAGDQPPERLEHIHALVDLGAALRRANRRTVAREPLRMGLELSHRGGATELAERARTELAATGSRPRRLMLTGIESLTPSERRVADLATQGLTTRQMATALYVTPKTVEYHLRHTYRKLDICSRSELTKVLAAEGAS